MNIWEIRKKFLREFLEEEKLKLNKNIIEKFECKRQIDAYI